MEYPLKTYTLQYMQRLWCRGYLQGKSITSIYAKYRRKDIDQMEAEITSNFDLSIQHRYMSTGQNSADFITRGLASTKLKINFRILNSRTFLDLKPINSLAWKCCGITWLLKRKEPCPRYFEQRVVANMSLYWKILRIFKILYISRQTSCEEILIWMFLLPESNSLPFTYTKITDLPKHRVNMIKPFLPTEVNYTGSLWVLSGEERIEIYILVFSCLEVRAVHLDFSRRHNRLLFFHCFHPIHQRL